MGLVHCLTEWFEDYSKLLDMNSCYKADLLEYVRGTTVALVLATNRILARIFWQHCFLGKKLSSDSKGKRAEMSRMFKISKNIDHAACKQNIFSRTTLPLGPKQSRPFFFSFFQKQRGSISLLKKKTTKQKHKQYKNIESLPVLGCYTVPK